MSDCNTCKHRDLSYDDFPCKVCYDGSYYVESEDCDRFENMRRVVNEIVSLLEKKNNDYGNSATQTYEEYGDVAFFIRISDKINRLKSLTINNKTQEVKDESIEDTVKDIIGYCLLYLEWKTSEEDK